MGIEPGRKRLRLLHAPAEGVGIAEHQQACFAFRFRRRGLVTLTLGADGDFGRKVREVGEPSAIARMQPIATRRIELVETRIHDGQSFGLDQTHQPLGGEQAHHQADRTEGEIGSDRNPTLLRRMHAGTSLNRQSLALLDHLAHNSGRYGVLTRRRVRP